MVIKGKKILICVSASIAAYKSVLLVRLLVKAGAEVKVVMTPAAKTFVSSLTLNTLSKNPVLSEMADEGTWANHVMLGRWADVIVIAPLSCNTLAKMAHGHCDNLLLAVYLSAVCPVVVAPAMDEDMWLHPSTKSNLSLLESFGNKVIPVGIGELASGLTGEGRMAEPESIISFLENEYFFNKSLAGKKAVVSAGPTYEPLDPVRFIGNHSSGKMGFAIARELHNRGAVVTLVLGPTNLKFNEEGITKINVKTAEEMHRAMVTSFADADIGVMAAAVADYTPVRISEKKIKKSSGTFTIELTKTVDILEDLGKAKRKEQVLIGFALETDNESENAKDKLKRKKADMIVLNSLNDTGAGFGYDTNKITIFSKEGREIQFDVKTKAAAAKDIIDTMIQHYYE